MKRDIEFWKKMLGLAEKDITKLLVKFNENILYIRAPAYGQHIKDYDLKLQSVQDISRKRVRYSKAAYRIIPRWNRKIPFNARNYAIYTAKVRLGILGKIRRKIARIENVRIPYIKAQIKRLDNLEEST